MFTLARRRCIGFCSAQAGFQDISSHLFTILSSWLHRRNSQTPCCWCAYVLKHMWELWPTLTRERTLGKHIGDLLVGVRILCLDFRIQTDSVTKLIEVKSLTLETCVSGVTSTLFDHLDHSFIVLKKKKRSLTGNVCVRWNILCSVNKSVVSPACILGVLTFFANGSHRASGSSTSITMSQRLRVRVHSNRSPASTDTIPTSLLLCETALPFSQDYDTDTNMRLPSVHNTHPEVDFEADAKSASWTIPEYTQMLYSLHGNIACNFQCAGCKESAWAVVCRKLCSIFSLITDLATYVR